VNLLKELNTPRYGLD